MYLQNRKFIYEKESAEISISHLDAVMKTEQILSG